MLQCNNELLLSCLVISYLLNKILNIFQRDIILVRDLGNEKVPDAIQHSEQ